MAPFITLFIAFPTVFFILFLAWIRDQQARYTRNSQIYLSGDTRMILQRVCVGWSYDSSWQLVQCYVLHLWLQKCWCNTSILPVVQQCSHTLTALPPALHDPNPGGWEYIYTVYVCWCCDDISLILVWGIFLLLLQEKVIKVCNEFKYPWLFIHMCF